MSPTEDLPPKTGLGVRVSELCYRPLYTRLVHHLQYSISIPCLSPVPGCYLLPPHDPPDPRTPPPKPRQRPDLGLYLRSPRSLVAVDRCVQCVLGLGAERVGEVPPGSRHDRRKEKSQLLGVGVGVGNRRRQAFAAAKLEARGMAFSRGREGATSPWGRGPVGTVVRGGGGWCLDGSGGSIASSPAEPPGGEGVPAWWKIDSR